MDLELSPIVNVVVDISPKSAARKGFNVALILGPSQIIPQNERVRIYTNASQLLTDGFGMDSAEYKAAKLYFAAVSSPRKLAVGAKYSGDSDIVKAAAACREANAEWYPIVPLRATDKEIEALAAWAETASPATVLAYTTSTTNNLQATTTANADDDEDTIGIFRRLKAKGYMRSIGLYCGQKDTPDAMTALMGYAMGQNRRTRESAFTLDSKHLPGVTPDDLTESQVQYAAGDRNTEGGNGNVYVRRADAYNLVEHGEMADGSYFDEVLMIDMFKNDITLAVMDLLYRMPKVPNTDTGVKSIVNVINGVCEDYVSMGFIGAGEWNGGNVMDLTNGTLLPNGYLVQHESVEDQSQADRDARIAPPIYVCLKTTGAIHYVTIEVKVNR